MCQQCRLRRFQKLTFSDFSSVKAVLGENSKVYFRPVLGKNQGGWGEWRSKNNKADYKTTHVRLEMLVTGSSILSGLISRTLTARRDSSCFPPKLLKAHFQNDDLYNWMRKSTVFLKNHLCPITLQRSLQ